LKRKKRKRSEEKTVEVLKDGLPTGVTVDLLPRNAVLVKGLQPEWPPNVRLEPELKQILVSFDGKVWVDRSDSVGLWILRSLDPRHLAKNASIRETFVEGKRIKSRGRATLHVPLDKAAKAVVWEFGLYDLLGTDLLRKQHARAAEKGLSFSIPIEIESKGKQMIGIKTTFPISGQQIVVRAS
jgi:hypothetical protein